MNPKVSIIIPVYNAESCLNKCLDSIINQTFNDIEIICVDDGSTDNSADILEKYSADNQRIKVIHKQNEGVSSARNTAIEQAKGEYLQFVDSDDWVEPCCVEHCYNSIKQDDVDITIFCHRRIDTNISDDNALMIDFLHNQKSIDYIFPFVTTVWNKIYKTSFIRSNNIKFVPDLKCDEDGIFNLMCIYKNAKISFLPEVLYNYELRQDNSAIKKNNMVEMEIKAFDYLINSVDFKNADENLKIFSISKFCFGMVYWYNISGKKPDDKENILNFLYILAQNVETNILDQSVGYISLSVQLALDAYILYNNSWFEKKEQSF